ncbi:MAG: hypothetical protein JXA78_11805 [Anaerolineales bacterium]|nr:hypothetical protein [Anaerolineales bacterium]
MTGKQVIQAKKAVKRRKPEEKELPLRQPTASEKAPTHLIAMQQQIGNQAVQRALERQGSGAHPAPNRLSPGIIMQTQVAQTAPQKKELSPEEVALNANIPGAGSDLASLVADLSTGLDTTLTLADFAGLAASGVLTSALVGGVSLAAAITFVISSMFGLADAYKTGEKLAAVMGESYGVLYAANGKDPPSAPGDWAAGASFNQAARDARKRLSEVVKKGGKPADNMLCFLIALRKDSEQGLNDIYQTLVKQNLQAKFMGIKLGGTLYNEAKSRRLAWPDVRWYYQKG